MYTDHASFRSQNSPQQFKTNTSMDFDVKGKTYAGGSVVMDYGLCRGSTGEQVM